MNKFFQSPENVEVIRKALNDALIASGYKTEYLEPSITMQMNCIDSLDTIDLLMQIEDILWGHHQVVFPRNLDSLADFDGALGDYPQFLFDKLKEIGGD